MANVGMPLQFSRMYKGPLDEKDVFESYELAVQYANSPIGYPGHVIAVKSTEYRRDVYVINDDKSLSHISVTRADLDITLLADGWSETRPYSYRVDVADLYEDDNVVVSMGSDADQDQYDAVINAKITNIEQGDGFVTFYCDEDKPDVDISIRLVVGGVINAVELPNSATVDTKLKTITVYSSQWDQETKTYRILVPDLLSSDYAIVSVASDLSDSQVDSILEAEIDVVEQGHGFIILKAEGILPTIDFDMTVAFGTNIVVVPNNETIKSETFSRNITLAAAGWIINSGISTVKYSQSFLLEGMTETANGSVYLPSTLSDEQVEALAAAEITIVQGDGSITFICNGTVPMFDITIGITYGEHINLIGGAPVFTDRTAVAQFASANLLAENWKYDDSSELYVYTIDNLVDMEEDANGCLSLANNISKEAEAEALRVNLTFDSVVDETILLTATSQPRVDIPISVIFGANIIVARPNYFNNADIAAAEDILYHHAKIVGQTLNIGLDYAINQIPASTDPSRTIMASVNNIPNGIIMKDAFNGKNYIMRMENGVMTTKELDSRLLPYFNGTEGINYPLNLYRVKDRLVEDVAYPSWTSLIESAQVMKSNGKLVFFSIGTDLDGRVAIGTIEEILDDIPDICDYIVFDVKSNCYLRAFNGSLYYTGGLYEYPAVTDFKVHGTIADRPASADKVGTIYYNTAAGEYYIWDGLSWVNMPTML